MIPAIAAELGVTPAALTGPVVKGSVSILKRASVVSGDHTITLQWRVTGLNASAAIAVSTGIEHGSLRVTEQASSDTGGSGNDDIVFQALVLRFPQQSTTTT